MPPCATQRDVSTFLMTRRATIYNPVAARLVPLCFRRRRFFLCFIGRVHQLLDVQHRRRVGLVHERDIMEGEEWMLLVSIYILARPHSARSPLSCDYSCFNAFSRVDVRVDVKIPGGVQAYVVDLRGERCVLRLLFLRAGPQAVADMKQHQKSGKRPSCPPSYVPSCTLMTPRTGWKPTVNSTQ